MLIERYMERFMNMGMCHSAKRILLGGRRIWINLVLGVIMKVVILWCRFLRIIRIRSRVNGLKGKYALKMMRCTIP